MQVLSYRQDKIKEQRKKTSRREFVMECASRQQFSFYKQSTGISRYPVTDRVNTLVHADDFFSANEGNCIEYDPKE
jgi:hypothetical protein